MKNYTSAEIKAILKSQEDNLAQELVNYLANATERDAIQLKILKIAIEQNTYKKITLIFDNLEGQGA